MKAYKISAKITAVTCGNGWNAFGGTELRSYKELYYTNREDALKHIGKYIEKCENCGIHIRPYKEDDGKMVWSTTTDNYRTYEVKLEEIDIKESF